jgi:hypothetical protein
VTLCLNRLSWLDSSPFSCTGWFGCGVSLHHRLRCYPRLWEVWRVSVELRKDSIRLDMPGWLGFLRVLDGCALRTWTCPARTASKRCFKLWQLLDAGALATLRFRCFGRSDAKAGALLQLLLRCKATGRHIVNINGCDMRMLLCLAVW